MLAERLGTNSGATSYHLRQLAEVGFVVDDDTRGNGRERWWRAAHDVTAWNDVDFEDDPTDRAATEWLARTHARMKSQWRDDWLATRDEYSKEWRAAAESSDHELRLTADELTRLNADLDAVIERYAQLHARASSAGLVAADGTVATEHESATASSDIERVVVLIDTFPSRDRRL